MGISKIVFPVYRNIIALILLVPFAYFLEKITSNQGFYLLGWDHTSPTFTSAIQKSVPALTFLMAVVLRIEQVRLNRKDGVAKVLGMVSCVAGPMVITLYKGPTIFGPAPIHQQTPVLGKYPARLSVTSYTCFFGVLQFLAIAAFFERNAQAWLVHTSGELFSVFYSIWCIDRGGPVFVVVYQSVQTLVVAIMASIALGEQFYLGGIIGAVLIITGLYLVLWGKSAEQKFIKQTASIPSTNGEHGDNSTANPTKSSLAQPLLNSTAEDVRDFKGKKVLKL
ncbi:hypothetical protein MKW92_002122 [Papaver armeniacum]|nr:hypothetical protein MKW92_002122 [Papaver armeniacum]